MALTGHDMPGSSGTVQIKQQRQRRPINTMMPRIIQMYYIRASEYEFDKHKFCSTEKLTNSTIINKAINYHYLAYIALAFVIHSCNRESVRLRRRLPNYLEL